VDNNNEYKHTIPEPTSINSSDSGQNSPYRYLKVSLGCIAIGLYAASFIGCSPLIVGQGMCRHEALYAATVCIENNQARIAMGPPGHAQAQCFIDGSWQWIHYKQDINRVIQSDKDNFTPERYETVEQFIQTIKYSYSWK